ncbi:MAG: hypothetical protein JO149_06400 [Gammaproteobacteria bacterium]|nr:hypothetical protein [Gammaproteobacteria bacterium]
MGIYAHYIELLRKNKEIARPFDSLTLRNLLKNATQDELKDREILVKQLSNKLKQTADFLATSTHELFANEFPLPNNALQREYIIYNIAEIYKQAVAKLKKNLSDDLNEKKIKEFAINYLQNSLGKAGLQNENGSFYLDMIKVYDAENPVTAYDALLTERLSYARKEKLINYLNILGVDYFTQKITEAYKNKLNGQDEIALLLNEEFTSLVVNRILNEQEQQLKNLLDDKVFPAISLKRNKLASQLREFTVTIARLAKDMTDLSTAATQADHSLEILTNDERAKLELFLAPYKRLAEIQNPFPAFDEEEAEAVGLKTVLTTTTGKYVGRHDATKKEAAHRYIDHLKKELSNCLTKDISEETATYLELLALCTANQGAFAYFIRDIKAKYGIHAHHPLFSFCEKCDTNNSQSLTIKTVQIMPRLTLLSQVIYRGKKKNNKEIASNEEKAFIYATTKGNEMALSEYINHPLIQEDVQQNPHIPAVKQSYHKAAFLIPETKINIKSYMRQKLNNFQFENDIKSLPLNLLVACYKYYCIDASHSHKASMIVNELEKIIAALTHSEDNFDANFVDIGSQLKKLKTGEHRTGLHRFFRIEDTMTSTLNELFKILERTSTTFQLQK